MLGCFCLLLLDLFRLIYIFDRNAGIEIWILEQLDLTLAGGYRYIDGIIKSWESRVPPQCHPPQDEILNVKHDFAACLNNRGPLKKSTRKW